MLPFERLDICQLNPAQIAPLEALFADSWPDTWRELATSHYVTLLSAPGSEAVAQTHLAKLAVALTMGIAQDLGGTQPYIPVGAEVMTSARTQRVIELLRNGKSYRDVATVIGITASRVRNIERAWRHEQMSLAQGKLDL
ncbi:MAG: Mor transcription activator family protein [Comamonas sp.]